MHCLHSVGKAILFFRFPLYFIVFDILNRTLKCKYFGVRPALWLKMCHFTSNSNICKNPVSPKMLLTTFLQSHDDILPLFIAVVRYFGRWFRFVVMSMIDEGTKCGNRLQCVKVSRRFYMCHFDRRRFFWGTWSRGKCANWNVIVVICEISERHRKSRIW